MYYDVNKEILYWVDYFNYEYKDSDALVDYIKNNYVKNEEFDLDDDYEKVGHGLYLNIFLLQEDKLELQKLNLIK